MDPEVFATEAARRPGPVALVFGDERTGLGREDLARCHALTRIPADAGQPSLNLAQAVIYIATAPKSNACTLAIGKARADVAGGRTLAVPTHLRDASYQGAKKLGHGVGYESSHDYEGGWVDQSYLPEARRYYEPVDRGHEAQIRLQMEARKPKPPSEPDA